MSSHRPRCTLNSATLKQKLVQPKDKLPNISYTAQCMLCGPVWSAWTSNLVEHKPSLKEEKHTLSRIPMFTFWTEMFWKRGKRGHLRPLWTTIMTPAVCHLQWSLEMPYQVLQPPLTASGAFHRSHDGVGQGLTVVSPLTPLVIVTTHPCFYTLAHLTTHMLNSSSMTFRGKTHTGMKLWVSTFCV